MATHSSSTCNAATPSAALSVMSSSDMAQPLPRATARARTPLLSFSAGEWLARRSVRARGVCVHRRLPKSTKNHCVLRTAEPAPASLLARGTFHESLCFLLPSPCCGAIRPAGANVVHTSSAAGLRLSSFFFVMWFRSFVSSKDHTLCFRFDAGPWTPADITLGEISERHAALGSQQEAFGTDVVCWWHGEWRVFKNLRRLRGPDTIKAGGIF